MARWCRWLADCVTFSVHEIPLFSRLSGSAHKHTAHQMDLRRVDWCHIKVLRSTGSVIDNFVRNEYTILVEVVDRIFSTSVDLITHMGKWRRGTRGSLILVCRAEPLTGVVPRKCVRGRTSWSGLEHEERCGLRLGCGICR